MPSLAAVGSLEDLYELVKAIKRMANWDQLQEWWFDRFRLRRTEGDRAKFELQQWLRVALKLRFPEKNDPEIDRLQEEWRALDWEAVKERWNQRSSL